MGLILNIETSSYVCSVVLAKDGKKIDCRESREDKSHATLLTTFIEDILKKNSLKANDLNAVSVSKGPGSYTGLRIGVSAAKGICYGAGIPLISVCSLHSMASGLLHSEQWKEKRPSVDFILSPMIDARRMEVYTAFYDSNLNMVQDISATIIYEDSFQDWLEKSVMVFFGNGADKCKEVINHSNALFIDSFHPSARFMTSISDRALLEGDFEETAYFEPFYLKDFVPTVPRKNIFT